MIFVVCMKPEEIYFLEDINEYTRISCNVKKPLLVRPKTMELD